MGYDGGLGIGIMVIELEIKKLKKLEGMGMSLKEIIEKEEGELIFMKKLRDKENDKW